MPGAIGTLAQESLDRDEASEPATFAGEANYEQGTLRELGRARLMDQAVMAAYRHLDPAELPEDVREKLVDANGELKPTEDWYHRPDSAESEMWDRYLSIEGGDFGTFLENQARRAYNAEFDATQQDLDGSVLRQRGLTGPSAEEEPGDHHRDYPLDTGFDQECGQWASHELADAP
jgi:hypothetical protein